MIFKKDGSRELYNLDTDLSETKDVLATNSEVAAKLTTLMRRHINEGRSTPGKVVAELATQLKRKEVSAVALATHFLDRLHGNPHNAFLDIQPDTTLAQARLCDEKIAQGLAGPLEGVPIAHKDIFVTQGFATTAGSRMLKAYQSPFDATVVTRLRQAGMVTLGKLNCDEFAMGSANENSAYGAVTNPWDASRIPGGSSGGSAAAIRSTSQVRNGPPLAVSQS